MAPKLLHDDTLLFQNLLKDVFPESTKDSLEAGAEEMEVMLKTVCGEDHLVYSDEFAAKMVQLHQTISLRHGVMLVGPCGTGKSTCLRVLSETLTRVTGTPHLLYTLDAKAMHKDELYGNLESTTREWTDGLFTQILRRIIENVRGEAGKVHWIVFDGDVDPEWVENLNSVLDDNKLLTLPNGERLSLGGNVRIIFEVDTLRYATPATVSRCGMVYFSLSTVTNVMMSSHFLSSVEDELHRETLRPLLLERKEEGEAESEGPVLRLLTQVLEWEHVMEMSAAQMMNTFFEMMRGTMEELEGRKAKGLGFELSREQEEGHLRRSAVTAVEWAMGGALLRAEDKTKLQQLMSAELGSVVPEGGSEEWRSSLDHNQWQPWADAVEAVEIDVHQCASPDVVIPTVDTVRHRALIAALLRRRMPVLLCGPPGSGKTMTLFSTLQSLPDLDVVTLNFSSATTPELLLSTFSHHCEFRTTPKGPVLRPSNPGRWLVLFCDEINLPAPDKYGTQRVITFLRQVCEKGGYWRTSDHQWVMLERIQFVGACNPPTDPGRVPLPPRFLRFAPVVLVGFPNRSSLSAIYGTMNRALLKLVPELRSMAGNLTDAMLDVYLACQKQFTPDQHPHYIFSPRELSRWVRSLYSALNALAGANGPALDIDKMARLWLHEGLRLFSDRLVEVSERQWLDQCIDNVAREHFGQGLVDAEATLKRPVLFSSWTTSHYESVQRAELRDYIKQRLKVFYEEELDVPLVLFNEVLDHILRIDRVFKQAQGHALLIGVSGGGKTVLSRFVAWLNGLTVFTIKVNSRYTFDDFRQDLRKVMLSAGAHDEKICFIFDESNVLDSNFLELMNTLLSSGEVPGLFEGEDLTQLLNACKDECNKKGLVVDADELYSWFVGRVRLNLHVVFTMNPSSPDFHNRSATSPALFNRCVLDWFGDWSDSALFQVASDFTHMLDMDSNVQHSLPAFAPPELFSLLEEVTGQLANPATVGHRDAALYCLVHMHNSVREANKVLEQRSGRKNYLTPRHFLDLIAQVVGLIQEKRNELEEQQLHLNMGLRKLSETEEEVSKLKVQLGQKKIELESKDKMANEKLQQMVGDQQEAEQKRQESIALGERLKVQEADIGVKKEAAEKDLAKAEPAVEEAKKSVSSIQKTHLDEIRGLRKPPQMIQRVLEAVCLMLGHGNLSWDQLRKVLMDSNFIPQIVSFDSKSIPKDTRAQLMEKYVSDPSFTFEAANRASKACGPLVKWLIAQIEFSEILNRVAPLREEVARLEEAAITIRKEAEETQRVLEELETKIAKLKAEYAELIRETEQIKGELNTVGEKVERSESLLGNLRTEQERWSSQSQSFSKNLSTLVGDCVLAAGFLSYIGPFDQQQRSALLNDWKLSLESVGIAYREDYSSPSDFLAFPSQQLEWREHSLPTDELCTENAVMLTRFYRYPLVIDPSGQATVFLLNMLAAKKVIKTSFLDSSFQKNLESALRFGCPILVEDVENIDPILNPILNKEVRKQGGRILIRLGDNDIDFSPTFVIYLVTRDPTAHFTPDLCSRVTLVNFTVTLAGLSAQCLSEMMGVERPDVEERRANAVKQQGEYQVALRAKEASLLDCISNAQGNLLQDDTVVKTLENLKKDALHIEEEVAKCQGVMEEITKLSEQVYGPVSRKAAQLYFAVTALQMVHFLYQPSLKHFQSCFTQALKECGGTKGLLDRLYALVYQYTARGLLNIHKPAFAMRLALCKLDVDQEAIEALLNTAPAEQTAKVPAQLAELAKCLRESPDQLEETAWSTVSKVMGDGWSELAEVVLKEETHHLIMLIGTQGNDPGKLVDNLLLNSTGKYERIALGSAEGFAAAEKALVQMSKNGGRLLLRNVHLAPQWLQSLEKRLHSLALHADFQLFMTSEVHDKLPKALLRACRVLIFENPPGLRSGVLHALRGLPGADAVPVPMERGRMHYLLAVLHALLTERTRYNPLGFTKAVPFSTTDLQVAVATSNAWIDALPSAQRPNVDPAALPWTAVRALLAQVVYGGRIDNAIDQRILESLIAKIVCVDSFDNASQLAPLSCHKIADFEQWCVANMKETTEPGQLYLPEQSHLLIQRKQGLELRHALSTLLQSAAGDTIEHSALNAKLAEQCGQWLQALPPYDESASLADLSPPLQRYWARERAAAKKKTATVRQQLTELLECLRGESHWTNDSRALAALLRRTGVPESWKSLLPSLLPVTEHLRLLAAHRVPTNRIGLLLHPRALLTATRQHAAQSLGVALESLHLSLCPQQQQPHVTLDALRLDAAAFDANTTALSPSASLSSPLPPLSLLWSQEAPSPALLAVPVYLNELRHDLFFTLHFPAAPEAQEQLIQAGVAVICCTSDK